MIELLRKRRSIRKFTSEPISSGDIAILREALLRSPSSCNFRPWQFVFVDDKDILKQLSLSKKTGSSLIAGAAIAVAVCGDDRISDVCVEDCSIASILLQMTAQSLGLGSCWVQIRNRHNAEDMCSEEYVRSVLGIPDSVMVESIVAIGHSAEKRDPVAAKDLPEEKIHQNRW